MVTQNQNLIETNCILSRKYDENQPSHSTYSIAFKFIDKNTMVNSVKSFT